MELQSYCVLSGSRATPPSRASGSRRSLHSLTDSESHLSRHTGSNDSHTCVTNIGDGVQLAPSTDTGLDNCQTVSSMTSFLTDASLQKSPVPATTAVHVAFTPPLSPLVTRSSLPAQSLLSDSYGNTAFMLPPQPSTSGLSRTGQSNGGPQTLPVTCVYNGEPPPQGATLVLPPMSSSQSMLILSAAPSSLPASNSLGSLSREPANDLLLQELQRLRHRVVQLESENTSMGKKLNQQQWEVEHRLAEIEMHICGSDTSQDSEEINVNKESII